MLTAPRMQITILALGLAAPILGLASTIEVNGVTQTTGVSGASSASLGAGGSASGTFNFTVDGGLYDVVGSFSALNPSGGPSTTTVLNATATYEGSAPSAGYSFTIDDLQDYTLTTVPGHASFDGSAGFGGPLGAGSSLAEQISYDGQVVGPLDFTSDGHQTTPLEAVSGLTSPLHTDLQFAFDFAAGAAPGAYITSTPEPGGVIPVVIILAFGLGIPMFRRSRLMSRETR